MQTDFTLSTSHDSDSDDDLDGEDGIDILTLTESSEEPLSYWESFKTISGLSLPMALSFTFSFQVVLVVLLLNRLSQSEEETAATTLISSLIDTLVTIGIAPLFAMGIVASKMYGEVKRAEEIQEDQESIQHKKAKLAGINRNGLMISAVVTPPIMATMIYAKPLLVALGQDEEVAQFTQDYLRPYSLAVPAILSRFCTEQFIFSFKHAPAAMLMALPNFVIGTGLATWFGYGGFGMPALGARGVAYGYVIESYATSICFALYISQMKTFKDYPFYNFTGNWQGNSKELKKLLTLSFPIASSVISYLLVNSITALMSGLQGTNQQAAWSYIAGFSFFIYILYAAFGQGTTQELARKIGQQHFNNANTIGTLGLLTTLAYITPPTVAIAIKPELLTYIFGHSNSDEVKAILKSVAPVAAMSILSSAAALNLLLQFRSLNKAGKSSTIYISGLSAGTLLAYLLGFHTPMGLAGIATGFFWGEAFVLSAFTPWWKHEIKADEIRDEVLSRDIEPTTMQCPSVTDCFRLSFFNSNKQKSRHQKHHHEEDSRETDMLQPMLWGIKDNIV